MSLLVSLGSGYGRRDFAVHAVSNETLDGKEIQTIALTSFTDSFEFQDRLGDVRVSVSVKSFVTFLIFSRTNGKIGCLSKCPVGRSC